MIGYVADQRAHVDKGRLLMPVLQWRRIGAGELELLLPEHLCVPLEGGELFGELAVVE